MKIPSLFSRTLTIWLAQLQQPATLPATCREMGFLEAWDPAVTMADFPPACPQQVPWAATVLPEVPHLPAPLATV